MKNHYFREGHGGLCYLCGSIEDDPIHIIPDDKYRPIPAAPFPKDDPVNHPKHYTSHPEGVECIKVTRHLNYNLGTAVAYIWRADYKGNRLQDLQKAAWHLNDEIQRQQTISDKTET